MRKIFVIIIGFVLLPAILSAAEPMNAQLIKVRNYAGPLAIVYGANGGDGGDTVNHYLICIATFSFDANLPTMVKSSNVYTSISGGAPIVAISWYLPSNTTYYYTDTVNKQTYFVKVIVTDDDGEESISPELAEMSLWVKTKATVTSVTGIDGYTINFDSQTATINFLITDINGGPAYPKELEIDIQKPDEVSILKSTFKINSFTLTDNGATCSSQWSGNWTNHAAGGHKHLGSYYVKATPTGYDQVGNSGGVWLGVDVVHINVGLGLIYKTVGGDMKCYGPPFTYDYYLSKNSFVMWRIYDRNQTETESDDTLVRVMVSSSPRVDGDTWSPFTIDDMVNQEVWDGRDNNGKIVSNDIYRFEFQAYEFQPEVPSGFVDASTDRSWVAGGLISYDVLRIVDLKTTGITATGGLASIGYYLSGVNTVQGGAIVKLLICKPNTRFTMASSAGSLTYLNGHTYSYVAGDLIPHTTDNLVTPAMTQVVKTFTFARQAGAQTETWDGKDEDGGTLANDNYIYGMSATDDSGNHATDNSGNDQPIWGNITIDRTASQAAVDTVAPTVNTASLTPAAGTIQTSGISQISCLITDTAQTGMTAAGFNVAASTIILTGPSGNVTGTKSYDLTTGMLILSFATPVTTNGTYTARVVPTDNSGNTATETTWTFSINVTAAGAAATFESSVKAYPNPAKGVPANIAYNINAPSTLTLEIFNLLGDLVYEKEWTKSSAGPYTEVWNLVNDSGSKIGSGVFIYRIKANDGTSTYSVTKKLIAIQ